MRIRLLGDFRVVVDGRPLPGDAWTSRRSAELVKLLALAPGRRLRREQVMEALWPELAPDAMAANLHKAAHLARRSLGADESVVLASGSAALWPAATVATDVDRFESATDHALASGDPSACREAASLYGGELLPDDPYAEWALRRRDELHLRHLEVLRRGELWEELVRADPADEEAHRALIAAHAAAGNGHAAIRQFRRLQDALSRELGVRPGPASMALYRQVVTGLAVPGHAPRRALVGREMELARARVALGLAAEGAGSVLLVSGEPGIGKTRLCEALLSEADEAGWATMHGAAREAEGAVPYAPVVGAIDRLLLDRPELAGAITEGARAALASLATAIPGSAPASPAALPRQQVLSAVTQLLTVASGDRGLLLFVDDVHAADDATIGLVHYVARASRPARLLAVLAFRPAEMPPALEQVCTSLRGQRLACELELMPLARAESQAMIQQVMGHAPSSATLDAIWELAAGNPFFTLELASTVGPDGLVAVPAGLYQAVDARLASLGRPLLGVLERAAIAGGELDADEFTVLSGLDEANAFAVLDDALAAGLLEVSGTAYRFRHRLVRDALVRKLAPHQRAAAHREAAERLGEAGAAPARVAYHFLAGGRGGHALPWLHRAATQAIAVSAFGDALRFVELALAHAPDRPDLLAMRADLRFATGNPAAVAAYAHAAAASQGEDQAVLRAKQAWAHLSLGDVPAAVAALEGTVAASAGARSRVLLVQGMVAWFRGALDEAQAAADEARRLATDAGNAADLLDATMIQAMVAHSQGGWPGRLRAEVFNAERAPELVTSVYDAHLCVAEAYLHSGVPYAEVISFAGALRSVAARLGAERGEAFAVTLLGEAELLSGAVDAAREHLVEGVRLHRRLGAACGLALSLHRMAEAAVLEGRAEAAAPLLDQALDAARESPLGARHVLARVFGTMVRAAPDLQSALAAVAEAGVGVSGPMESCPPCSVAFLVPAAIACAEGGQLDHARGLLAGAEGVIGVFWPGGGGWWAGVAEARGHLALAENDRMSAVAHLDEAASEFTRCGQPLDAERCREASRQIGNAGSRQETVTT